MMRIALPAVAITVAALLVSCATQQTPSPAAHPRAVKLADGVVTQLNPHHGNAYTTIRPDQYGPLGLEAGKHIHVAFPDAAMTLVLGNDYTDVPTGTPLAVLHREGLTFAIRDGDFSATYGVAVGTRFTISTAPQH